MNFSTAEIKGFSSPLFNAYHPLMGSAAHEFQLVSSMETCNQMAREKFIVSGGDQPIRFVPPSSTKRDPYEVTIFLTGEIETREAARHDLFNAWVWLTFPKTKAAINAAHYHALQARPSRARRSGIEDALTLLDENGVVVACSDPELVELLTSAHWKTVFWDRRADTISRMQAFLFGHGLLEKALRPYVGMCAHSVILPVQREFFLLSLADQLKAVDEGLAQHVVRGGQSFNTQRMTAIPLLGFPGYFADNGQEGFYDNPCYFRPKASSQGKV